MPNFTYDGFLTAASNAGLLGEFSQADLDTARKYPEFGYSILGLKQDIHKATTPEAKLLANEAANQLRSSYGGYTGGKYGADYISDGKIPNQIDSVLDKINGFGSFTFDQERPSYENQYAEQQQALLDAIINRPDFSWSKEDDPQWHSYRKSYLREGDRATADALGQAAAASGGRPSTAAVTAATQAGDYYAAQLNDIIPTLYQQAYDRYLNEYNMSLQDLNAVNTQEQLDYAKYLDQLGQFNTDRNFAFNQYLSDFDILQNQLASLQGQDSVDYNRWMDKVGLYEQKQAEETWPGPGGCHSGRRRKPQRGSGGRLRIRERVCPGPGGSLPAAGCPAGSRRRRSVQQFRRREVQDDADHGQTGSKRRRLFGRRSGCLAGERVYRRDAEGDLWIRAKQRRKRNDHRRLSAGGCGAEYRERHEPG